MKRLFFISLVILLCAYALQGSYFRNYQVESGLSHNSVWTVMQDSEGFLWFGTNDGLNRFDGKQFKIYRKSANDEYSLGHNFIHSVKEISRRRMLVGTRNGLYLYNRDLDNFSYVPITGKRDKEVNVNDIMEDLNGNVWVACHGEGLFRLNAELEVEESFVATGKHGCIPSNYLWTVVSDLYGDLWIGTAGKGLVRFDLKEKKFSVIADRDDLRVKNQSVYSIYCDKGNVLWVGTSTNGLFKYNTVTGKAKHFLKNTSNVKGIGLYSDHELIMGSELGLVLFDKERESFRVVRDNLAGNATNNSIFAIARDREGAFWIGTYFGGVNYFSPSTNDFLYYNNYLDNTPQKYIVSSFVEDDDGSILLSTHTNNIIYRFYPKEQRVEQAFKVGYNNVECLMKDEDKLYVGVYGRGVDVLSLSDGRLLDNLNVNVIGSNSILKLSSGEKIFVIDGLGCDFMDTAGNRKRLLDRVMVADVTQDERGTVWFATYSDGLHAWNVDGSWRHYAGLPDSTQNIFDGGLACIASDGPYLWIGTKSEGVILFDTRKDEVLNVFDTDEGLPSGAIFSILRDENGNMWVGTKEGIARISAGTHEIKSFGYIGREMQHNPGCSFHSSDNRLYFGGSNGFISLQPEKLFINEQVPSVAITDFRVDNKTVVPGEKSSPLKRALADTREIVLKRSQSNFSFGFVSLSFVFPETNRYAYMLEGFDKEWTYTSENTAQYMNIPSGKYVFRVKGTNNDGVWNEADTHITLRVKPPFWLSYYMIMLYLAVVGSAVFVAFKLYLKKVDQKNKEKQYKYQIAKEKEMYESKISFFTNIAHEIRTPLSLITAPLENIIRSDDGNEQTKKNLSTIERNTNRLLDLVNQLLDFRKIENDMFLLNFRYQNVVKIVQKVYDQYAQEAKTKGIDFLMELPEQKVLSYVDQEAVYKIISNLISNAIKFTRTKIELRLKVENDRLVLSVKDDGVGLKGEHADKIFEPFYQVEVTDSFNNKGTGLGLSLSQSLARKLRGDIYVESVFGEGSLFVLELPILADEHMEANQLPEEKEEVELPEQLENADVDSDVAVLIVEDNEELRVFMRECLVEQYKVYEAENGVKALELIEENNVDIIVSDILMPEMDGLELCNELKTNTAYSHLPIILLSAKTDTSTKVDGLKKGADVYMEKPFSVEQLKAQISSIVDNRANVRKKFVEAPLHYFKKNTDKSENAEFIKKLNAFIVENMSNENFSIDSLSGEFAISRTNFQKKIKNITGLTSNNYVKLIRLNKSAELLATGKYRINEVCFLVGFNTPSYFSKLFYEHFGKLPKDFMQDNQE